MADDATLKRNKAVVLRFNREVIERGDVAAFRDIMAADFVNRTAPPGMSMGPDGMLSMFKDLLRPAFPDLRVEVHDQIAEGDKVTTRKTIRLVKDDRASGDWQPAIATIVSNQSSKALGGWLRQLSSCSRLASQVIFRRIRTYTGQ